MDVRIRQAVADDADAIEAIRRRGWQAAYRGLVPDDYLDSLSDSFDATRWRAWLEEQGDERGWVAERDGTVVGFVTAGPSRDEDAGERTGEIYGLYVEPRLFGTGVGRALIGRALADLRDRGFAPVTLWVLHGNTRAKRFYERAGFVLDGTEKHEPREWFTMHEVRYRLDPESRGPTG